MQNTNENSSINAQGADAKLTPSEFTAFKGLEMFISEGIPMYSEHPSNYVDISDFIFGMKDLFSDLDHFLTGRFKCDCGYNDLADVYRDAIKNHPNYSDQYMYQYSELMRLLLGIHEAKKVIDVFSGVFEIISDKLQWYESEKERQ